MKTLINHANSTLDDTPKNVIEIITTLQDRARKNISTPYSLLPENDSL
jgi:hypothetical protein